MTEQVLIQINFTATTDDGLQYSDALYFTQEEYAALTPEQIEAEKQNRFNRWLDLIQNPPAQPPAPKQTVYTKFGFRGLFSQDELIAIDNYDTNSNLPTEAKAAIKSFLFSFQVADEIDLNDPATQAGVNFLEQCGLIGSGRAAVILGV